MRDRLTRMRDEAEARMHDADILAASLHRRSDSHALLEVLAFEVLLKAALLIAHGVPPKGNHKYGELWNDLPFDVRTQLLTHAKQRMAGHTDFSDMENLLNWWQFVFLKARYYYELYDGYTLDEQRAEGDHWISIGAPADKAKVQYFPLELRCLTEALLTHVDNACRAPDGSV